jgi:histone H3/H4
MAKTKFIEGKNKNNIAMKEPRGQPIKATTFNNNKIKNKKTYKIKKGTGALREIRKYQKGTKNLINKTRFQRLVRSIGSEQNPDLRYEKDTFNALQDSSENKLLRLLMNANMCAIHAKRQMLYPKDLVLAKNIVNNENM